MENVVTEVDYKAEFERLQAENAKLKTAFDKASSEVASYKRKDKERMTDDEKRNAEMAERENYYKEIERQNSLYKFKESLGSQIKDNVVLNEIAECYANNDITGAIQKQNEYYAKMQIELEKSIKDNLRKQNPQATPDITKSNKTLSEMSLDERVELKIRDPELYNKLKNKN